MVEEIPQKEQASPEIVEDTSPVNTDSDLPVEAVQKKPETIIPVGDYRTDPLFYAIADYFNIAPEEYAKGKDYISEIVDYVIKDTESNDPVVLLEAIREIEDQVQPPQWGEKRYWNIRKYVRLASQKKNIDKAMGAFKKDPNV